MSRSFMRYATLPLFLGGCPEDHGDDHDHDHDHSHNGHHHHHHDDDDHDGVRDYEDGMVARTSGGHYDVALTLSGGATVGVHTVTLFLDHHGQPADPDAKTVTFDAFMPGHGHGTDPVTVEPGDAPGEFIAEGLNLTMAGVWDLTVTVDRPNHGGEAVFSIEVE